MATAIPSDVDQARRRLRELIGEQENSSAWEPHDLDVILGSSTSLEEAAAEVWKQKAARYAELTDVDEGGSSRKMSQLHKNALSMMSTYSDLASGAPVAGELLGSRTRPISRP